MTDYPYVDKEKELVYFNKDFMVGQFVETRWNNSTKSHYISRNYLYTSNGDILSVDVRDLLKSSNVKVIAICPNCNYRRDVIFQSIIKYGHTKCNGCSQIKDLTGLVANRLIVIKQDKDYKHGVMWLCRCVCGELISVRGDSLQDGNTQSCGCLNKESSRKRSAEKSPHWNPNLTDEHRNSFRVKGSKNWAMGVKSRDKYTCQCCGQIGYDLVSHHLNSYRYFPEQRLSSENGVTVCEDCHKEFHNWMGDNRVKCTSDDFIKFCKVFYPHSLFLTNNPVFSYRYGSGILSEREESVEEYLNRVGNLDVEVGDVEW